MISLVQTSRNAPGERDTAGDVLSLVASPVVDDDADAATAVGEGEGVAELDLDAIAAGERDVPALQGWRHEVFGADALRLCNGEIALAAKGQMVKVVNI